MVVAITDEYAVRLRVEYPDVTRFLTAYWPTPETDDATALHAMLSTARAADVSWWRRQLLLFLLSSADDADKAAFVRMSARRRFQTERPEDALTWLGTIVLALLDIEDYLARSSPRTEWRAAIARRRSVCHDSSTLTAGAAPSHGHQSLGDACCSVAPCPPAALVVAASSRPSPRARHPARACRRALTAPVHTLTPQPIRWRQAP